jgi:hypothetical protein
MEDEEFMKNERREKQESGEKKQKGNEILTRRHTNVRGRKAALAVEAPYREVTEQKGRGQKG